MSLNDIIKNDDDLLDELYWHEQNEGGIFTKKINEITKNIHIEREKEYKKILNILEKLEDKKIKDELAELIENYAETFREEQSCNDEHCFKYGFRDAVRLILQSYNYN